MKIRPVGAELFRADGRTDDRRGDANSRFSQLCEKRLQAHLVSQMLFFGGIGNTPYRPMTFFISKLTRNSSIPYCVEFEDCLWTECRPGSSVGIATELRAGRSEIESRWGRDFPPVQAGPGAHPSSCKMGTESFPGVKCGRGVLLTTHPLLVPRSWKSTAIPLPTLWATPGL